MATGALGTARLVAANELRRRLRDRSALVVAFVAPIALSAVLGFAFHGGGGRRVSVAVASDAGGAAPAAALRRVVGDGVVVTPEPSAVELRSAVRRGKVDLGVLYRSDGRPLVVVRSDEPLGSSVAASLASALDEQTFTPQPPADSVAAPVTVVDRTVGGAHGLVGYFAPSMGIVFLFFVASVAARGLLAEREVGTLARLRSAPVSPTAVVAGKVAAMFAMSLASIFVLWAVTVHAFGATWGAPGAVAVVCVAVAAAMTGLGAIVTVHSRTAEQSLAVSGIVGFVLALLGGNFFPPGSLPSFLVTASRATPNGWALQAFGTLSLDHGTMGDVATAATVLGGMGVAFGAYAWAAVRRTVLA